MKRLLLFLLVLSAPWAARAQYATTSDGNGGVVITGFSPNTVTSLAIPSTINGSTVTGIGSAAFEDFTSLTNVTIPNTVTAIGSDAFNDCVLITSVTLGTGVTSIGDEAFEDCQSLGMITIPNSVTSIGVSAFNGCGNLTSITIGSGLTAIADDTFDGCVSLASVTIPNNVTSIGADAFFDCPNMTAVTLGSGVTSIGDEAFFDCESLTTVTISASVTSIGVGPFAMCLDLTAITVASGNSNYSSSTDGVLFDRANATLIQCPGAKTATYVVPSTVTTIADESFDGCETLTGVTIPNSVTSIGDHAFQACTNMTTATIGTGVISIGPFAFGSCSSLGSVTIPAGVTTIGESAFSFCSSLPSVTIPNGVTSIGSNAFQACTGLTHVTIGSGVATMGQFVFYACSHLTSALFNGNAPTVGQSIFLSDASGFTVSYFGNATGFTTPTWTDSAGDVYPTTVLQISQTITFPALIVEVYPSTVTLTATASSGLPVTYSLMSGGAIASLSGNTLTLSGPGTVTIQASQAGNAGFTAATSVQQSFNVVQADPLSNWEQTFAITNLSATAFGDSVPNLLKYIFNINPTVPMSAATRAALPALGSDTTTTPGTTYVTLTYRRFAAASGVTMNVQSTSDLQTWQTVTPDIIQQVGTDSSTGDPIVEVEVKVTTARQFIRLQVTAP